MPKTAPLAVAFREVRHFKPDDSLHCEPIQVRGELHDWTIPAHRHDGLHQFQLLARGRARVRIDDAAHVLDGPAALMIAPGSVHAFEYERGCAGLQVTVPTALLAQALGEAPALAPTLARSIVLDAAAIGDADDAALLERRFADLSDEFGATARAGRSEALRALAVVVALWFLRRAAARDAAAADAGRAALRDALVQRYRALLEGHFRSHRPVSYYAGALHVTPDHLSRACRTLHGVSALDLLHERVLLEARRLLAYTDAPVATIAAELGFADAAYFSRFFRRRAGQPPLAYRAGVQTGTAAPAGGRAAAPAP